MSAADPVPSWMVGTTPRFRTASSIEPRELDPVWDGVLWAGKPTMLAGDPGLGKSMVTVDVSARVSTGAPWPCSDAQREPGNVVMLSAEDDPDDTIVPRLKAAGANLGRVTFVEGLTVRDEEGERAAWLCLDRDIAHLETVVEARKPRLIVIDPVSAYMGTVDSHKNADVRIVLAQLGELASRHRAAVLVVSHLNKSSGKAMYRITGSLAFTAAARAVYAVTKDPDDEAVRLFLPVKSNLGPDTDGYRYAVKVNDDSVPYVEWGTERETRRVGDILGDDASPRESARNQRESDAVDWLQDKLGDGPQSADSMWKAATDAGFSERDIRKAKRAAGIKAEILGYQGKWHWRL